jgi:hypothetical protein
MESSPRQLGCARPCNGRHRPQLRDREAQDKDKIIDPNIVQEATIATFPKPDWNGSPSDATQPGLLDNGRRLPNRNN